MQTNPPQNFSTNRFKLCTFLKFLLFRSQYSLLSEDLKSLLKEVERLRKIADSIVCTCDEPECPFRLQPDGRTESLPTEDCVYVSDEEDYVYGPLQMCRFMRTQPGRRGSAPGNRNQPRLALRTLRHRAGSISNTLSVPYSSLSIALRGSLSTVDPPSLNMVKPISN